MKKLLWLGAAIIVIALVVWIWPNKPKDPDDVSVCAAPEGYEVITATEPGEEYYIVKVMGQKKGAIYWSGRMFKFIEYYPSGDKDSTGFDELREWARSDEVKLDLGLVVLETKPGCNKNQLFVRKVYKPTAQPVFCTEENLYTHAGQPDFEEKIESLFGAELKVSEAKGNLFGLKDSKGDIYCFLKKDMAVTFYSQPVVDHGLSSYQRFDFGHMDSGANGSIGHVFATEGLPKFIEKLTVYKNDWLVNESWEEYAREYYEISGDYAEGFEQNPYERCKFMGAHAHIVPVPKSLQDLCTDQSW